MFRLSQIIRNFFIRLEGFISYQFRKLFGFLYQIFAFFSKLFGFTESQYFLENQAEGIKQAETAVKTPSTSDRRHPDAKMDYYLKLAQPKKTSK